MLAATVTIITPIRLNDLSILVFTASTRFISPLRILLAVLSVIQSPRFRPSMVINCLYMTKAYIFFRLIFTNNAGIRGYSVAGALAITFISTAIGVGNALMASVVRVGPT